MDDAKVRQRRPPRLLAPFFLLFGFAGLAVLAAGLASLAEYVASHDWRELPCEIVDSRVIEHPGEDEPTYSVGVTYRFGLDGVAHTGDRYDFGVGSSSGREAKQAVVDGLPPGSDVTCFVDPADPSRSVLVRQLGASTFLLLFPIPFLAVGFGGAVWVLRPARLRDVREAPASPPAPIDPDGVTQGPLQLRRAGSRWFAAIALSVFGCIWTGSTLAAALTTDATVPVVFGAIGVLVVLAALPYQVLKALNPVPEVVLSRSELGPGSTFELLWRLDGRAGRVERLTIRLVGTERVTYRRGSETGHASHVFYACVLAEVTGPEVAGGATSGQVPEGAMHSFAARHNRIVWSLDVHGEIRRWPDVADSFEITVQPKRPS